MAKMGNTITSDDILGKTAIAPNGAVLGVVIKMHIQKDAKIITGLTIDQGFMKPDLFVGIDYIKNFGVDTVFLSKMPFNKYIGMQVLTSEGNSIGHVKDFVIERKRISKFVVSHKFSKKIVYIPTNSIKEIGGSIILKSGFKEDLV
ncbi:MAG: PRC-barrel domain-containing protein [Candidatus Woesearchaeota archaeon]